AASRFQEPPWAARLAPECQGHCWLRSSSVPPRPAHDPICAFNTHHIALVCTQAQFGRTEQPVHDVIRRTKAIVHQLPITLSADDEQRRQFALRDATGKLDIDLLAIVEG